MSEQSTLRVGDAERSAVASRLSEAHAEGRLSLTEFDERVRDAWAARTAAELAPLTSDLPTPSPVPAGPERPARRADAGLRAAVAVWAAVSLLNVAIWLAVSVGVGEPVYPWWVWVAGPWGAMLALGALAGPAGVPTPCAALPGVRRR